MALAWQSAAWADVSEEGDALVVRVGGELDEASRPSVEPVVTAAVGSRDTVVVDLGELSFCDSSGIALLIAVARRAEVSNCRLVVENLQPAVRRVFDVVCLHEILELRD
jgi:anti-sigma B factor antagonist